jgi:hypothetical protein
MDGVINFLRFTIITGVSLYLAYIGPTPGFLTNISLEQWWIPFLLKFYVLEIVLLSIIPRKRRKAE